MKTFTATNSKKKAALTLKKRVITANNSKIPGILDPTVIIQTLTILV